jgi:hypothetical protein
LSGSASRAPSAPSKVAERGAPAPRENVAPPLPAEAPDESTADLFAAPPAKKGADAPLPVDTSPGGCATGECLPETPAPEPVRGRDDATRALIDRWRAAVDTVAAESPRHAASLKHARLLHLRDGEVGIAFRGDAGFHRTTVTGQSGRPVVERLLATHFGRPTRLVVDETAGAAAGAKTLAEIDAEARAEHERATGQSVRNHPAILATLRILGGELEHIQVLEHERTGAPGSDVIDEQP